MKFRTTILHILFLICGLFWVGAACSAERNVLFVLSNSSEMYFEIFAVVESELLKQFNQQVKIHNIDVASIEEGRAPNNLSEMELVVSIGTKAARTIAGWKSTAPRLYTFVPKSAVEQILSQSSNNEADSSYGIYLDQPFSRELSLTKILLKGEKSIGVLLGPVSQLDKKELLKLGTAAGFSVKFAEVDTMTNGYASSRNLIEKSDVIITLPDPVALSPQRTKWLLYQSYQKKIPIISFSNSFVKAGALAAVYSTPRQIGQQAGEFATEILRHSEIKNKFKYPSYFEVAINRAVARSLGLEIEDEKDLVESIQGMEHD